MVAQFFGRLYRLLSLPFIQRIRQQYLPGNRERVTQISHLRYDDIVSS